MSKAITPASRAVQQADETVALVAKYQERYRWFMDLPEELRAGVRFYHAPDAAGAAEAMLADRQPATDEVILKWLRMLSSAVTTGNLGEDGLDKRIWALSFALGKLPRVCWTEDTLRLAMTKPSMKFFPSVAELSEILQPIADEHEAAMHFAERHVNAPVACDDYPRESTVPYRPVANLAPQRERAPAPPTKAEAAEAAADRRHLPFIQPPVRTPQEQIDF